LKLKTVGVHDSFFELGGHSILATQVISRVRKTFQINIPLRDLFTASTIAQLAEIIDTITWAVQGTSTSSNIPAEESEEVEI
jgi:hypothetical protein